MPAYQQLSKNQHPKDVHHFGGTEHLASLSQLNKESNSFNFSNSEIAKGRSSGGFARPNALSKTSSGTFYGGSVGAQD